MADGLDRDLAQAVVLGVGQGLRWGDDDALPGVDPHRVEILHVADRDAVVHGVADDFVFDFLPALEIFLDEDLGGVSEGLFQGLP